MRSGGAAQVLARLCVTVLAVVLPAAKVLCAQETPQLRLVSARDHIEGSFVVSGAVCADQDRIYLASFQGTLFILARDRDANFPLIQTIHDTDAALTGVRVNEDFLFVSSVDGHLRIYRKQFPLRLTDDLQLSEIGLSTVELLDESAVLGRGEATLAVNERRLFLSSLNQGETAFEIDSR